MDDGCSERLRNIYQRKKRWSMNSQRLEVIVAELMKPISDVRRSFDTDLSALLEEYLTEAGLHVLDAEEAGVNTIIPNFAELALLLQQSASIYSRKVDFLYQHVLNVSDSLQQSTQEVANDNTEEHQTPSSSRRKRKTSTHEEFTPIGLEASSAARRDVTPRVPPTLPRAYVELEPRVLADCDAPLLDYGGEPVGLLGDFHVAWRLQDGFLVEELSRASATPQRSLRPVRLAELQAAIVAATPTSPVAPCPPSPARSASPPDTPCSPPPTPPTCSVPPPVAASTPVADSVLGTLASTVKKERKRRSEVKLEDIMDGAIKIRIDGELKRRLRRIEEFRLPDEWVQRVVRARASSVRAERTRIQLAERADDSEFHGFEESDSMDIGGFAGWSSSEVVRVTEAAGVTRRAEESDDDGFFEQLSLGDSDGSRVDDCPSATALSVSVASPLDAATPLPAPHNTAACPHTLPGARPEWASWREGVVARAAASEARGADVQRAAAGLLAAVQELPPHPRFDTLLARTAQERADVSKLFLATLFLANSGNVDIIQGPPLTLDTFSVRLVSTDQRLYRAAQDPLLR